MLLLTTKFVKNSHIKASIFFIFLTNVLKQTWVTKNVRKVKFEGVWCELETKEVSKDNNAQNIWD